jgi:hypothetical protein
MRTVILENRVSEQLEAAVTRFPRIEEAYRGLEWRLCRRPQDGIHRTSNFFIYKQDGIRNLNIPTLTVLYRFNENEVGIIAMRITEAS